MRRDGDAQSAFSREIEHLCPSSVFAYGAPATSIYSDEHIQHLALRCAITRHYEAITSFKREKKG